MNHEQVTDIVGSPGSIMFMWSGCGGLGANANVMFQNDVEVSKAQFGLG
jgi:hypothetical protein